jgi:hypothetical protein
MPGRSLLHQFLGERRVPHDGVDLRPPATMRYGTTSISERTCAKLFTCFVDGLPIEAILPASLTVNLTRLLALAGGREIRSAPVGEATWPFRDGDAEITRSSDRADARPIFVDVALASEAEIGFAPDGADPTYLRWDEFARTVRPIVGRFAEPPLLWARCRLSPSE